MAKVALLPSDIESRGRYLCNRELPEKYMEDFTLMGLVVDRYRDAFTLLCAAGFRLDELDCGADIRIDNPLRLPEIVELLNHNNIHCEFSDIADTLYQA